MKNIIIYIIAGSLMMTGCTKSVEALPTTMPESTTTVEILPPDIQSDLEALEARVPILIYHHIREYRNTDSANDKTFIVAPTNLREQLQYLKDNDFNPISFQSLIDYFNGDFNLPDKPIIISFDDGVINQYNNAFNLLKEFGFQATFFIFPNPIGKSVNYMTWEQLAELRDAGMEIGSHGWYHQYLTRIDDNELERELIKSKTVLEEQLGIKITTIAYPFGDINNDIAEKIKNAGYLAARDIVNGVNHRKQDLFRLKGYFITNDFDRFKSIVNKANHD